MRPGVRPPTQEELELLILYRGLQAKERIEAGLTIHMDEWNLYEMIPWENVTPELKDRALEYGQKFDHVDLKS